MYVQIRFTSCAIAKKYNDYVDASEPGQPLIRFVDTEYVSRLGNAHKLRNTRTGQPMVIPFEEVVYLESVT